MDIVEELRRNRESGAKRLVCEYKAGLMVVARRFFRNDSDAEQAVNATFAKVIENIDGFIEKSSLFTWMSQILVNEFRMSVRRKSNDMEVMPGELPDVPDEDAEEAIFRNLDHSLLREAVNDLPEDQREAVVLHYFMDMPVAKIAKFLAIPNGTVFSRLHYARKALAAKLGVKAHEAVRKPGVKATLIALALCAVTALGAGTRLAVVRLLSSPQVAAEQQADNSKDAGHATSAMGGATSPLPSVAEDGDHPATSLSHSPTLSLSNSSTGENMNTTLRTIAASAAFAAASAGAPLESSASIDTPEMVVVGTGEIMTVEISSDTAWDKPVFVDGVLRKTGAGKLTITGEKLYGHGRIEVSDGELDVSATGVGSDAIAEPSSVLAGAAMWLDAGQHVAGLDGAAATGDAAKWFDVREENWATPNAARRYIYAEGMTNLANNAAWPTLGSDDASRPYIYFGGFGSGQYMLWRTPAGGKAWIPVCSSFAAYNPAGTHGNYLGSATAPGEDANKQQYFATTGSAQSGKYFSLECNGIYNHLRNGRIFRNGERVSVSDPIDLSAVQVLETESYPAGKGAESFFNFRNYQQRAGSFTYGNRVGGGRLHEVVVFTNAIAETDRVVVGHWLLRKWVNRSGYGALPGFSVARGATLSIPGAMASKAVVESDGTVRIDGGTADLGTANLADVFKGVGGVVELSGGASVSNRAGVAIASDAGKVYDADAFNTVAVSSGAASEIRKTGAGALALAGLDSATSVAVDAGTATVRAIAGGESVILSENVVSGGGFEGIITTTGSSGFQNYSSGQTFGAWTSSTYPGASGVARIAHKDYTTMGNHKAAEGSYFLVLKQGGGATQPISLSKSGRYEITLRVSERDGYRGFARIYVDGILVGTAQTPAHTVWDTARFETPWLEAGENHELKILSETTCDTAVSIDDVQMRWLDAIHAVAVPNENFEDAGWDRGTSQIDINNAIAASNVLDAAYVTKWMTSGGVELLRALPYLRSNVAFDAPVTGTGSVSAFLPKGASLSQTVTVPENGLYQLSALLCQYAKAGQNIAQSEASVRLALGAASETLAVTNLSAKRVSMSNAVRLSAGDTVTVSISSENVTAANNNVLVDDVRLERLDNLVANPGFEGGGANKKSPAGWTVAANPEDKQILYDGFSDNAAHNFGPDIAEGEFKARLHSGTRLEQTIPLSAGLYRLSFWDVSRLYNYSVGNGPSPIRVTLAKNGVTNFCATVTPSASSKVFMRREFLVRADEPGNWTLGFESMSTGDKSSFIDAVCLVPASGLAADAGPDIGAKATISIADGALLGLDWPGVIEASRVRCAGVPLPGGDATAASAPDSLFGIGTIRVKPLATIMLFK